MKKNNFFNFKQKNIWDIGWPMSPRKFYFFVGMPMIIIMFIVMLSSCNRPVGMVRKPEGKIVTIYKSSDEIYIKVNFDTDVNDQYVSEWFIGSDTCKVGQIVRLK